LGYQTTRKNPRKRDLNATQKGPISVINVRNIEARARSVFYINLYRIKKV
jgi:hypothetical protein